MCHPCRQNGRCLVGILPNPTKFLLELGQRAQQRRPDRSPSCRTVRCVTQSTNPTQRSDLLARKESAPPVSTPRQHSTAVPRPLGGFLARSSTSSQRCMYQYVGRDSPAITTTFPECGNINVKQKQARKSPPCIQYSFQAYSSQKA